MGVIKDAGVVCVEAWAARRGGTKALALPLHVPRGQMTSINHLEETSHNKPPKTQTEES